MMPGLIHHYFGRKENLVVAVIEPFGYRYQLEEFLAAAPDRAAADVLVAIPSDFGALLEDGADLMTIFFTRLANPAVGASLDQYMESGRQLLAEFLTHGVASRELREHDTRAAANLFLSAIVFGQLTDSTIPPPVLVTLLLDGLDARPTAPRPPGGRGRRSRARPSHERAENVLGARRPEDKSSRRYLLTSGSV